MVGIIQVIIIILLLSMIWLLILVLFNSQRTINQGARLSRLLNDKTSQIKSKELEGQSSQSVQMSKRASTIVIFYCFAFDSIKFLFLCQTEVESAEQVLRFAKAEAHGLEEVSCWALLYKIKHLSNFEYPQ